MAGQLKFHSFRRSLAASGATQLGGRLQGHLKLTMDELNGNRHVEPTIDFLLMGPRDVIALKPGAVRRTYPVNGAFNVETDKCPYVEFAAEDLPWRYSPDPNGDGMRPWLLLVVGTPEEATLLSGNRVVLSQSLVSDYAGAGGDANPRLWAHTQEHEGTLVSRLLSPRLLQSNQSYVAVIVPAFNAAGTLSLPAHTPIPAFYAWQFSTSDTDGSFRDLAMRLWPLKPIPNNLGMAPVAYQTASDQETLQPQMLTGGALVGLNSPAPAPVPAEVNAHFSLIRPRVDPVFQHDEDGRPLVHLPLLGEPWLKPGDPEPAWMKELNDDPRQRGAAGLGLWAGIEWQDRIVEAASKQLGAFYSAARRIRQLTVGLAASRSLWDRRLPKEETHKLQVLGLAMSRLATPQGTSALQHTTAADRPMPPALFSSAARRMLRPGTARARLASQDALLPAAIFERMNTCPPDNLEHPVGLVHADPLCDGSLVDAIRATLDHGFELPIDGTALEDSGRLHDDERIQLVAAGIDDDDTWLDAIAAIGDDEDIRKELLIDTHGPFPSRACESRGADLPKLSGVLTDAFNPHGANAFVIQRVLSTIEGLDDQPLTPPELCLDFHIPAWKFLKEFAPDWFLPGLAQLQFDQLDAAGQPILGPDGLPLRDNLKDPVIAAETNGRFSDAFMVGFNQQALAELRWRNVPVVTGCTPLHRFWEPIRPAPPVSDGQAGEDILGIHAWGSTPLGDPAHETLETRGDNLVLIFKTQLWRRYPETLVYLLPDLNGEPNWEVDHILPNLHFEVDRDVVGFGFAKSASILPDYWLVIEQIPRGFTFFNRSRPEGQLADQQANSAQFARVAYAQAVRVLIRGTELMP
jgi:hypothetical protein